MWIALGIIGAATLINLSLLVIGLSRLRETEIFMVIVSGVLIGMESNAELAAYLKARSDHPAGKKRRVNGDKRGAGSRDDIPGTFQGGNDE